MEKLRTKITKINKRYYVRLLENDLLINEMACKLKIDVGFCCKYMLRWYDKLGGESKMASASRARQKTILMPAGKVWYERALRENRRI